MKRNLKYAIMVSLMWCACQSNESDTQFIPEEGNPPIAFEGVERQFSVSFDRDSVEKSTRSSFEYNNKNFSGERYTWIVGDKMTVSFGKNQSTLTATEVPSRLEAVFKGTVPTDSVEYAYAICPVKTVSNWAAVSVAAPATQTQTGNSTVHLSKYINIYANDFATRNWSKEDVNGLLDFHHIDGFFRFSFQNQTAKEISVKSVSLKDKTGKKVFTTSALADLTAKEIVVTPSASASTVTLKMNGATVKSDSIFSGYMACLPSELGETLTYTVTANVVGKSETVTFSGDFNVKSLFGTTEILSGHFYYLKFALTDERMHTISPKWNSSVSEAQKEVILNMIDNMVYIENGSFNMGAQGTDPSGLNYYTVPGFPLYESPTDEAPVHKVTLTKDYFMDKYLLTQKEWYILMENQKSWSSEYGMGENYPAYQVSWVDAVRLIAKIRLLSGITFRLPTEAQWEFAARGGNKSNGYLFAGSNDVSTVAWHSGNSGSKSHLVGEKLPNELGLYDMSGNLAEWCADFYAENYYSVSPEKDPTGPTSGAKMVVRNNCWGWGAPLCRIARRDCNVNSAANAYVGIRLAYMY